jgi:hypothetical protein
MEMFLIRVPALAVCLGGAVLVLAQGNSSVPVKLVVDTASSNIRAGETAGIKVGLRDGQNRPAKANKNYDVQLEVRLGNGKPDVRRVTIQSGNDSTQVPIPFPQPGIYRVQASNRELREGDTYVQVKSTGKSSAESSRTEFLPVQQRESQAEPSANPQSIRLMDRAPGSPLDLRLEFADAGVIANNADQAKIQAFLVDAPAPRDIKLQFSVGNGGNLSPNPLVIHKGEQNAEARLTSSLPGDITVKYEYCQPEKSVEVVTNREKQVKFKAPITAIRLIASPDHIPLSQTATLQVVLLDNNMKPIAADEDIDVQISQQGLGSVSPNPVSIPTGKESGIAVFTPKEATDFSFSATARGATTSVPQKLNVRFPWIPLTASIIGGFIGGFIGALRQAHPARSDILIRATIGTVAAAILFYACENHWFTRLCPENDTSPWWLISSILAGYVGIELLERFRRLLVPAAI